jgi:hypothetical protein
VAIVEHQKVGCPPIYTLEHFLDHGWLFLAGVRGLVES